MNFIEAIIVIIIIFTSFTSDFQDDWLMTGGHVTCHQGFLPPSLLPFLPPSLLLMCVVEQDGFDHARQDLGHVGAHDLRDHFREVDSRLQRLGADK